MARDMPFQIAQDAPMCRANQFRTVRSIAIVVRHESVFVRLVDLIKEIVNHLRG